MEGYYSRKEQVNIVDTIVDMIDNDADVSERQRLSMYKKNKALQKINNPKPKYKAINLDDYTLQEIENDIELQILAAKRQRTA